MGRKKKLPLIPDLVITDIAAEGRAVGKAGDMVVFVGGLVPGDIADIQIKRKRKKYMEGYPVTLKKASEMRREPFCKHFNECGGCRWQNLSYEQQLIFKQKQVEDTLKRIGKVDFPQIQTIIPSQRKTYYRNKLEYTFTDLRWLSREEIDSGAVISDRRSLGFHYPGRFNRITDIYECFLQDPLSNTIRNAVREFTLQNNYTYYNQEKYEGLMRNLVIRNTSRNEWMVICVFRNDEKERIDLLMQFLKQRFPEITSLLYIINDKKNDTVFDREVHTYYGNDYIVEHIDDLKYKIGPRSFFQTNILQATQMYRKIIEMASIQKEHVVYDLYTGTGSIALYVAKHCKKVIGLENVEDAICDAGANCELNDIHNASFFCGDIKDMLNDDFLNTQGMPDVLITDPPRAGMHPKVTGTVLKAAPPVIMYVSCNPSSQARDINLLSEKYTITDIQPLDMFPHTEHVENIVRLDLTK